MIPLLHDFSGETILIFGGGAVGARKARRFAREGDVVVVSPAFANADFGAGPADPDGAVTSDNGSGDVARVRAKPAPDDVSGWLDRVAPALVVAATDDAALNDRIERDAIERGVLVNRADTHEQCVPGSVMVPATVRDGDVVVSVSTGGSVPALSRHLRARLETEVAHSGAMADVLGDLREELQDRGVSPDRRRAAVRAVVGSPRVWKLLDTSRSKARQVAKDVVIEELDND